MNTQLSSCRVASGRDCLAGRRGHDQVFSCLVGYVWRPKLVAQLHVYG